MAPDRRPGRGGLRPALPPDFTPTHTPVERRGPFWLKRDDLYCFAGVRGGKVRSCLALAQAAKEQFGDSPGTLITASSRHSPQMVIVARIAERLGLGARCHMPTGADTEEMALARQAGAVIVPHRPGYNTVIVARAIEEARGDTRFFYIPFGMKCVEAVEQTAEQVVNLPRANAFQRIVISVGSGISLAGLLTGLERHRPDLLGKEIIGVRVGADPTKTLDALAPFGWARRVRLLPAKVAYHQMVDGAQIAEVPIDPHYEGKVLPFLNTGDLFWVVGIRPSVG